MIDPPFYPWQCDFFFQDQCSGALPRDNEAFRSPRNNVSACNGNRLRMFKQNKLLF